TFCQITTQFTHSLPYIFPIPSLCLLYVSPMSSLCLPYVSPMSPLCLRYDYAPLTLLSAYIY
ncbi:MAG: hypothetical protein IJ169_02850, partial [Paludibacteraceae bacterium]|nr:hypothetical protein [Paludibacteraceae bacterium]